MFGLTPLTRRSTMPAEVNRNDPFQVMRHQFDTLFDRMMGEWPLALRDDFEFPRRWGLEVEETETAVVVKAELPGFEVNDIDLHLTDNVLTIEAKHKVEVEGKEENEKEFRHMRRSFTLPGNLDLEKVEATYRNGVLEVTLPRTPEAQGRRIEVKA